MRPSPRFLIYTIAFDPPGAGGARQMAKLLASSILRSCFDADLVIFRNRESPIFFIERKGVEEFYIETPVLEGDDLAEFAMAWKPVARHHLSVEGYERVIFLDADCLMLRGIEHLLGGGEDILFQPEHGRRVNGDCFNAFLSGEEMVSLTDLGVNSGTWAVRAEVFGDVMSEWERLMGGEPARETRWVEQGAWNRLLLDRGPAGLSAAAFEPGEVQFPLHIDRDCVQHADAAILHFLGTHQEEKLRHMFGTYMRHYFFDPRLTLLNILEA